MNSQTFGMIIGGVAPAVLFGLSGVFAKSSTQAGIGLPFYLGIVGLAAIVVGAMFHLYEPDTTVSSQSALYASLVGSTWALGAGLAALGLMKFQVPVSKLVPLYNMNTLIAVLLGLWVFSEWKAISIPQLLLGSVFIVVGGVLVSRA